MREGTICILRRAIDGISKGTILYVHQAHDDVSIARVEKILPHPEAGRQRVFEVSYDTLRTTDLTLNDINQGRVRLEVQIRNGIVEFLLQDNRYVVKSVETRYPTGINLPIDELKKMFKYIPVQYVNNELGFYNPENSTIYLRYKKDKKSNKESIILIDWDENNVPGRFNIGALSKFCTFRVKSYEKSSKLFHFTNIKKEAVGKIVEVTKFELQGKVKKSEELENSVYVKINDSNYRFSLEDIEIIYPNIKGWNPEKDRNFRIGVNVRVVNDKHLTVIKRNDKLPVNDIKKIGNKTYIGVAFNGKTMYERSNKFKVI